VLLEQQRELKDPSVYKDHKGLKDLQVLRLEPQDQQVRQDHRVLKVQVDQVQDQEDHKVLKVV
jgi:hypothetical protein